MKEKYLQKLLTQKNNPLWEKIENKDNINIIIWDNNFSELFSDDYTTEFRLNSLNINSFNHELCHVYINQVFGGIFPTLKLRMPYELSNYITRNCLQHISNCIEHKLFFDLYLEIGGESKQ
ncbi:MAG: hypothetical protein QOA70_03955, partial [Nitrososphaeraceae archaeon]|nr:hypothetical protein [Nitrososphaeraceae archaeon]